MNEDNDLCEGNLEVCIDCTADVRVCDACGKRVVFESGNQPVDGCPLVAGERLPEFEICGDCYGTFCIDCMDDTGEICKKCSNYQWDDLTIFTGGGGGGNDEPRETTGGEGGLASLFGRLPEEGPYAPFFGITPEQGPPPYTEYVPPIRRRVDQRLSHMPRNDLMRLWDVIANVHPHLREMLGFPAPAIEGITENDFRARIGDALDDMSLDDVDGVYRYITEVIDAENGISVPDELDVLPHHPHVSESPDYGDTEQYIHVGGMRGQGRSGFMEALRRTFNSHDPNPPTELGDQTIVWGASEGDTPGELRNFIDRLHEHEMGDRRRRVDRLSLDLGEAAEWDRWVNEIPFIKFPRRWNVQPIPPTMGAIVRFVVGRGHHTISVFLDGYGTLGSHRVPYWEINPGSGEDAVDRFDMNDIPGLLHGIEMSFRKMNRDERVRR